MSKPVLGFGFPRLTAVRLINKRRTEIAFPYCSSAQDRFAVLEPNFTSEFKLTIVDRIFPVLPLLVSLNS